MTCTSSQCLCTSTTYYSSPNCVSRISYGGTCSLTILCDTTLGLQCTSSVCTCNSTQYWSTLSNGTQICANLRTLGQSCTASSDCVNSATSVKCTSNICECDSSAYYLQQSTVTCQPLKAVGVACTPTYNFECSSFNCNASNVCGNTISSTIKSNVSQASLAPLFKQTSSMVFLWMNIIYFFFFLNILNHII